MQGETGKRGTASSEQDSVTCYQYTLLTRIAHRVRHWIRRCVGSYACMLAKLLGMGGLARRLAMLLKRGGL